MKVSSICIHFIEEDSDCIYSHEYVNHVPRVGDEVRFGGRDNEDFFTVTRVVWVYDEPEHSFERVNIGIKKAE